LIKQFLSHYGFGISSAFPAITWDVRGICLYFICGRPVDPSRSYDYPVILWLILAMAFNTVPSYEPVTASNMNYSIVVMGGWLAAVWCDPFLYLGP
jgi:hypothetical protein